MNEFIYVGKAGSTNGKTIYGFLPVEKHNPDSTVQILNGSTTWFQSKKAPCRSIGAVYELPEARYDDDGNLTGYSRAPVFVRPFNSPFTVAWQDRSRRHEQDKQTATREKQAVNDREFAEALRVLKDRFKKLPFGSKSSFKVWLLDQLRD